MTITPTRNKFLLALVFAMFLLCSNVNAQVWQWGENTNGIGYNEGYAVSSDNAGNGYITGAFNSPSVSFGSTTLTTLSGNVSMFLVKYNTKGNVVWAKNPGGTGSPVGQAVTTDDKANVYVTGSFGSPSVVFGTTTLTTASSGANVFLVKYDSSGNVLWAKSAGGSGTDVGNSVSVDTKGNVYLTGLYSSLACSFGSVVLHNKGSDNIFLAKYDSTGKLMWVKSLGGSGADVGKSVSVDTSGNVYLSGTFNSPSITVGTTKLTNTGSVNMFLARYDGAGNVKWVTSAGGTADDVAFSNSADIKGNIYVGGYMTSPVVTFGSTVFNASSNGSSFLVKYDSTGKVAWAKSTGGAGGDIVYSLSTNLNDEVYIAGGYTPSDTMVIGSFSLIPPLFSSDPLFVAKFDAGGTCLWAKALSSGGDDQNGISVAPCGVIYIGGDFETNPFIVGNDSLILTGNEAIFMAQIVDSTAQPGVLAITSSAIPGSICEGDSTSLLVSGAASFVWNPSTSLGCATCSNTIATPSTTTTYTITGKTGVCMGTQAVIVTVDSTVIPAVSHSQYMCSGNSVVLNASGGSSYSWSNGATTSSITVSPGTQTQYSVTVLNGLCKAKDSTTVFVNPLPNVIACCDTVIFSGDNVQLTATGGITYLWVPSSGLSCVNCPNPLASPLQNTTYTVTITSDSGCNAEKTITVDVDCRSIFVPNAFSPNGDNENDFECVYGGCIQSMDFSIFDRWGNRVFWTNDQGHCWDGRYNGELMNSGVYVYELEVVLVGGTEVSKKGNITLMR